MRDLVRIIEDYCAANNIQFRYGSQAHLNLLESDINDDQIYLLLFPVTRRAIVNLNGTAVQGRRFIGRLMWLKGSDYANHYFNENDSDPADSKYTINIEPFLTTDQSFLEAMMCANLEIVNHECDDAVNVLDANKDGLWCRFHYIQRR